MNKKLNIDKTWTLFLDRDGVINEKRENDYVKNWGEFSFTNGALFAISRLSKIFGKIIVVTNQRGVEKGIMTEIQLISIHDNLTKAVNQSGGRIDKIFYYTDLLDKSEDRKPNIGMAVKAKMYFPEIDFRKSIMIGDSMTDMEFGKKLSMYTIYIIRMELETELFKLVDYKCDSLFHAAEHLINL
jgi:D-glycero-D-manno-heptose 1,7-bisphosphate phosphatase